jgi:hypothetical protein
LLGRFLGGFERLRNRIDALVDVVDLMIDEAFCRAAGRVNVFETT